MHKHTQVEYPAPTAACLLYLPAMTDRFWATTPNTSPTAPRITAASSASAPPSLPLLFSSRSNHLHAKGTPGCQVYQRTAVQESPCNWLGRGHTATKTYYSPTACSEGGMHQALVACTYRLLPPQYDAPDNTPKTVSHPISWCSMDLNSICRTRRDSACPATAKLHCCSAVAISTPQAMAKNIQE